MSQIKNILPPGNVFFDLDVGSKKRVFEQVGLLLENSEKLSRSTVFDSLFARERLGSTGLGHGVAIPHGRIKGLREAVGVLIRLKAPILFDAPDGKPVSLLAWRALASAFSTNVTCGSSASGTFIAPCGMHSICNGRNRCSNSRSLPALLLAITRREGRDMGEATRVQ